jgi:signal transduction histidine kinase
VNLAPVTLADLRAIDLFDDLDDMQLQEWLAVARPYAFEPGEVLAEQGEVPPGVQFLLEGSVETFLVDQERSERVGRQQAPTWMLAIAAMTGGTLGVQMVAQTACRVAIVDREDFRRLAFAQPTVHDRVMRQVAPVMTRLTAIEQNRERLAALGTMAAGLAHELNNPAAAARSAATQLVETLDTVNATLHRFVDAGVEREEAAQLIELQQHAVARAAHQTALDALDAADAEDDLRDRLEELGIPDAWRLAEPLAAAGVDDAWIRQVTELAGPAADAALRWVAASLTAHGLAAELEESTDRMSKLVSSVKTYAYMDRGELVEVDVHEGLETTLAVLGHKLKHTAIKVERDYDTALPKLTVRGSELNQVWTNLLDNAIDALGDAGTIAVRTRRDGGCAEISVADDGPGIPPDVREHLFDPFFTTKDVGHGTGLGLATARRIVVDRHDGSLSLDSRPGATVFTVRLPLERNGST